MEVSAGKILKYTILPGILPRTNELFASGFSHVSLFMALAFRIADLLPPNHPYLNPANTGRFGIRQVLAEARRHLVFRRENLDQIIIYYTVMTGLFLIFTQFVFLAFSLTLHAANATSFPSAVGFGPWVGQFFDTPAAGTAGDVAFIILDRVFGFLDPTNPALPFYGSCASPTIPCPAILAVELKAQPGDAWPTPFHAGMHILYNFYDMGVAAVGLIIFTYLVATVTAETAQTGVPFGRRFNHTWVIPRLVVAVVLLIPWDPYQGPAGSTNYINGAQAITLHVAKWGSNLATNGWVLFNNKMVTAGGANYTLGGLPANMVVNPNPPSYNNFVEFMTLVRVCKYAEETITQEAGQPAIKIDAYQVNEGANTQQVMPGVGNFNTALTYSKNQDIVIVFGELNAAVYTHDPAGVKPICGKVTVHITDLSTPGALKVQSEYYDIIANLWGPPPNDPTGCGLDAPAPNGFARAIVERFTPNPDKNPNAVIPTAAFVTCMKNFMNAAVKQAVIDGHIAAVGDPNWTTTYTTLGWGGAAIWYNKLAEYNGSYVTSVFNLPSVDNYPEVMEYIRLQHAGHHADDSGQEAYKPVLGDNDRIFYRKPAEDNIAQALYYAQSFWFDQYQKSTGNQVVDYMKAVFGVQGVYNMLDNLDINPLAQLVGLGKSLMEATVIQLTGRIIFGALGKTAWGTAFKAVGNMAETIMGITFSVGFTLFYILPFVPFVYFFFAVGAWVKAVFEAMVGMPLWALSFVNIEGEGLPGRNGMSGVYLLLEILLRPILIIFGLIASISIFMAQVRVLHEIWYLVVSNLGGDDTLKAVGSGTPGETESITYIRDTIEDFFYTVIYTVIVYMMAMASFKLIDVIPAKILRWMGSSVNTFGSEGDPGKQLMGIGTNIAHQGMSPIHDAFK